MGNQADNEKKAQKLKEMMNDENYELNLDALEDAAGGSDDESVDTYYETYRWYLDKHGYKK